MLGGLRKVLEFIVNYYGDTCFGNALLRVCLLCDSPEILVCLCVVAGWFWSCLCGCIWLVSFGFLCYVLTFRMDLMLFGVLLNVC